jgi:molybdopterin-guanine dinucleotide biosynthesis protein A
MPFSPAVPPAAAILAGGAARRMGGAVKALLDVGGRSILDRLTETLAPRFAELLLVAKDASTFQPVAAQASWRLVTDALPGRSSLTGVHAALTHAGAQHVFLTACDTPFLRGALVDALLAWLRPEDDVVLPQKPDGYFEPLCAIYSRRCLPHIAAQLERGDHKIINFFPMVRVRPLPVELLLRTDPEMLSFRNANTPHELRALREAIAAPQVRDQEPL